MARNNDDSFESRRRQRENEEEVEKNQGTLKTPQKPSKTGGSAATVSVDSILEQTRLADLMIDQIHNLYQMFLSGVERLPPHEKQKQLEKTILNIQNHISQTPAAKFRFNTLHARYLSYKDRWEKSLLNLESGKVKRTK